MDNAASDELLATRFTEAWIPIHHTPRILSKLDHLYRMGRFKATGTYACEIYAGRRSEFWMNPSQADDSIRIDLFWFAKNEGDPAKDYYPQFWELFEP